MSTSARELKSPRPATPIAMADDSGELPVRVGSVVAFALYPDELVPATVTALHPTGAIDYTYVLHEKIKVEDGMDAYGMMVQRLVDNDRPVTGTLARHLDPCERPGGIAPLPAPQGGHFTPGTWFDPSPYVLNVTCYREAQPEQRAISRQAGVLGTLISPARPAEQQQLGPFADFATASEAVRKAKESGRWSAVTTAWMRKVMA